MVENDTNSREDDQQIPNKIEPKGTKNYYQTELKLFFSHFELQW